MMELKNFSGQRICVAISGGIDSVSLLHYLKRMEKECGYTLCAVHCEHGIRGEESLADARFVEEFCLQQGVPLYRFSEDCPARAKRDKQSLETAARNFRKECFEKVLLDGKADFIATAHHKNDDAETVLFRLMRGTSLTGVGGMAEVNGKVIRPFLSWTRAEIEAYATQNKLAYCEDSTNYELDATRNKLRLNVLPLMEEAVPGTVENLVRFSQLAIEDDGLLYEYAKELLTEREEDVTVAFCGKKPLFRRACLLALKGLGVERDYTALHLENAYRLQSLERGARLSFPKGVEAEKTEKGVRFYKVCEETPAVKPASQKFTEIGFDGGRYEVIPQGEYLASGYKQRISPLFNTREMFLTRLKSVVNFLVQTEPIHSISQALRKYPSTLTTLLTRCGQVPRAVNSKSIKDMWLLKIIYGGFKPSMLIFSILFFFPMRAHFDKNQISQVR